MDRRDDDVRQDRRFAGGQGRHLDVGDMVATLVGLRVLEDLDLVDDGIDPVAGAVHGTVGDAHDVLRILGEAVAQPREVTCIVVDAVASDEFMDLNPVCRSKTRFGIVSHGRGQPSVREVQGRCSGWCAGSEAQRVSGHVHEAVLVWPVGNLLVDDVGESERQMRIA